MSRSTTESGYLPRYVLLKVEKGSAVERFLPRCGGEAELHTAGERVDTAGATTAGMVSILEA